MQQQQETRAVRAVVVIRPPPTASLHLPSALTLHHHPPPGGTTLHCGDPTPPPSTSPPSKTTKSFTFPAVYGHNGPPLDTLCSQEIEPLLQGCFRGESAAVLAYGATGTGKSFISGTEYKIKPWEHSITNYVAQRIWAVADTAKSSANNSNKKRQMEDFSVAVSFIEIYREGSSRESTFDLLAGYIRMPLQGYATGAQHDVSSPEEMMQKIVGGSGLRNTDATDGNARSSRSHAILTIYLRYTTTDPKTKRKQRVSGRLMVVDLAGAEAASSSSNSGSNVQQQRQGSGINVGLSALQLVIREVAEQGKTLHYRDSKLTHILKPALGGQGGRQGCAAVCIGCVSPSVLDLKRTMHTLQYMQQAARIRNTLIADVEEVGAKREAALLQERELLKSRIAALAGELQAAKQQQQQQDTTSRTSASTSDVVVLTVQEYNELMEKKDRVIALEVVIQKDQERFERLNAMGQGEYNTFKEVDAPTTESPLVSALSVSPILSAAASMSTSTSTTSTTMPPLLQHKEAETLMDSVCLPPHVSHLSSEQLLVLQKLITERFGALFTTAITTGSSSSSSSCTQDEQVTQKQQREEISALRLTVAAYNECLGAMGADLALAREEKTEALQQLHQAAWEKVQYVELVSKYQQALDVSQYDVVELEAEVKELKQRAGGGEASVGGVHHVGGGGGVVGSAASVVIARFSSCCYKNCGRECWAQWKCNALCQQPNTLSCEATRARTEGRWRCESVSSRYNF